MQKFYFLIFLFFSCAMANEFIVRYQPLSSGSIYHIETKYGEPIGKVIRNSQGQEVSFCVYGKEEELLARCETEKIECENRVRFFKADGSSLGSFTTDFCNLYPSEYSIYSPHYQLIAKGHINWLCNHLVLTQPDNPKHLFVTFHRPMFKLYNDHWHFQIHESGQIHFAILCMIGVFQTACDLNFEISDPKTYCLSSKEPLSSPSH